RGGEQQADEAAHERAAGGAGTGVAGLVDLDLAVGVAGDDDDVVELEDLLLRHPDQLVANLLSGRAIRIRHRDQIAHLALLGGVFEPRLAAAPYYESLGMTTEPVAPSAPCSGDDSCGLPTADFRRARLRAIPSPVGQQGVEDDHVEREDRQRG